MSTRSDIIAKRADGTWARIYCHHDGYLEHVGLTLYNHYNSQERADALMALGDLSSLRERCDKPEGHSFTNPVEGCTVAYGRDRGETGTEATTGATLEAVWPGSDTWTEFTYAWDGQQWMVGDAQEGPSSLKPLLAAFKAEVEVTPRVQAFGATIGQHKPLTKPLV